MKVLLIVKSKMMETLGPMYLSAVIKKSGHDCKIESLDKSKKLIANWKPDLVGCSIMTGDQNKFKSLYESLKHPPTFIVGGPHPTFFPEDCGWANFIILGEAEQAIADLLQSGLKFPDIGTLPWPDRTDFPDFKIRDFISSRGCPRKCRYCFNAKWAELSPKYKKVRTRPVGDMINELQWCKGKLDMKYVFFQDSCFGVNMRWMAEFSTEYRRKIKLPYQCNFRPEQINEERVRYLSDSNCVAIRMALETAVEHLRKIAGRNGYKLEDVQNAAKLLTDNNIMYMLQNILGLPTSTIEDDLNTLEFNILCKPTYAWASIYQPYPGTELGDLCKKEGWYKGRDMTDSFFETSFLEIPEDHREQLEVLQKIFSLCSDNQYLPSVDELTHKNLPKLVHKIIRKTGDRKLYIGLL